MHNTSKYLLSVLIVFIINCGEEYSVSNDIVIHHRKYQGDLLTVNLHENNVAVVCNENSFKRYSGRWEFNNETLEFHFSNEIIYIDNIKSDSLVNEVNRIETWKLSGSSPFGFRRLFLKREIFYEEIDSPEFTCTYR